MCEVMTALTLSQAMLAMSAGSAVLGLISQANNADAQESAVRANAAAQAEQTKQQYTQINQQATDKMSARAREALIEQGRLRTVSGETGLAGISADRIQAESQFNAGTDMASMNVNRVSALEAARLGAQANVAKSMSQLNSIAQPNIAATGLQIAGAYGSYRTEQLRIAGISTPKPAVNVVATQ